MAAPEIHDNTDVAKTNLPVDLRIGESEVYISYEEEEIMHDSICKRYKINRDMVILEVYDSW